MPTPNKQYPNAAVISAFVCRGCGAIYWVNHINCDCNVNSSSVGNVSMERVAVVMKGPSMASLRSILGTKAAKVEPKSQSKSPA